jgi:hypothetical protein
VDPLSVGLGASLVRLLKGGNKEAGTGLVGRALGPLADEIGLGLAERHQVRRQQNLARIVEAAEKMGGSAPPNMRVLGEVVENGSWCDSEIAAIYLGGVLAGSRTGCAEDDSGLPWARLINGLSAAELALHYMSYAAVREAAMSTELPSLDDERNTMALRVTIPYVYWEYGTGGVYDRSQASSAVVGLRRVGLLADIYECDEESDDFHVSPTHAGIELFMRGLGASHITSYGSIGSNDATRELNPDMTILLRQVFESYDGRVPLVDAAS